MILREAIETDVEAIRDIFLETYGADYPHPEFYDLRQLKKAVYSDDNTVLVAEDESNGRVAGTASVLLGFGAFDDLVAEFGRLAVHPDYRGKGVGDLLMDKRIERVQNRIYLGLVENRSAHPFSQKISAKRDFA